MSTGFTIARLSTSPVSMAPVSANWLQRMTNDPRIADTEIEIDKGDFEHAHQLLAPLVEEGNARAIFLWGTIGKQGESQKQFEERYINAMKIAASKGEPDAIYALGVLFDQGEAGFKADKKQASELFRKAADLGHLRCKWIHACELLWGLGSYPQDVSRGIKYLEESINGKFDEALETMARIHEQGEFSFAKNPELAQELRSRKRSSKE